MANSTQPTYSFGAETSGARIMSILAPGCVTETPVDKEIDELLSEIYSLLVHFNTLTYGAPGDPFSSAEEIRGYVDGNDQKLEGLLRARASLLPPSGAADLGSRISIEQVRDHLKYKVEGKEGRRFVDLCPLKPFPPFRPQLV